MKTKNASKASGPLSIVPEWERPAAGNAPLLALGALVAQHQVAKLFGDAAEIARGQAVTAGIVAALKEVLPARQFGQVMVQWEIDAFQLTELLELAAGPAGDEPTEV